MSLFPQHRPDSIALYTQNSVWSYGRLEKAAKTIVEAIGERTLVFCLCTNTPASIAAYVGCLNYGIVPAMIDGEIDRELLLRLIENYHPSYIWLPKSRMDELGGYKKIFSLAGYVLLACKAKILTALYPDLALLMTTSGSTGSPKFVRLSYQNIRANIESIIEYLSIDENERAITNLPMHYVYGLSIINTHLYVGAAIVVTDKTLFQKEFWNLFKEREVTSFGGVPYTFSMLERLGFLRMKLPSLHTITQAGGKLDSELHKKFATYAEKQGKRFFVMYGAAEATARMGYLPAEDGLRKCGSMGIAIPRGRFELCDDNGKIIEESDKVGELVYIGQNVMLGYAVQSGDLIKDDEMRGILATGDLAKRDTEGFFTIVGRKKRFLKMFGKRTNLEEVEHLLRRHFTLTDIACSGVDDHLYIFLAEEVPVENVISYVSNRLGIHPSGFEVKYIDKIPKNASGKTMYRDLDIYIVEKAAK